MTEHLQVEVKVPPHAILMQGNCPSCDSSFGILQPDSDDKFPLFCPYCCHRAVYSRLKVDVHD